MSMNAHLRVARPTDNLDEIASMYRLGLEMQILAEFRGHENFDGVVLGRPDLGYQLEFTHQTGHTVGGAPTKDNLLVFYHPNKGDWERACAKMVMAGFRTVKSYNPYWDRQGLTFEDPDGYRVVMQNARAPGVAEEGA
jgi:hypothetical protein